MQSPSWFSCEEYRTKMTENMGEENFAAEEEEIALFCLEVYLADVRTSTLEQGVAPMVVLTFLDFEPIVFEQPAPAGFGLGHGEAPPSTQDPFRETNNGNTYAGVEARNIESRCCTRVPFCIGKGKSGDGIGESDRGNRDAGLATEGTNSDQQQQQQQQQQHPPRAFFSIGRGKSCTFVARPRSLSRALHGDNTSVVTLALATRVSERKAIVLGSCMIDLLAKAGPDYASRPGLPRPGSSWAHSSIRSEPRDRKGRLVAAVNLTISLYRLGTADHFRLPDNEAITDASTRPCHRENADPLEATPNTSSSCLNMSLPVFNLSEGATLHFDRRQDKCRYLVDRGTMLAGHLGEGGCSGLFAEGQSAPISKPQRVDQSDYVPGLPTECQGVPISKPQHVDQSESVPRLSTECQGVPISKPQQVDQSESVTVQGADVSSCSPMIGLRSSSKFVMKPGRPPSHITSAITDDNDPRILEKETSNGLEVSLSREIVVEDFGPRYRTLNGVTQMTVAENTIQATTCTPSKPETSNETHSIENGPTLQETIRPTSTRDSRVIAVYQGVGGETFKTPPSCGHDMPLMILGKASSPMGPMSVELEIFPQAAKEGDASNSFVSKKQVVKSGERQCTLENVESYTSRKRDGIGVEVRSKGESVDAVAVPGEGAGTIGTVGERTETRGFTRRDKASRKAAANYDGLPGNNDLKLSWRPNNTGRSGASVGDSDFFFGTIGVEDLKDMAGQYPCCDVPARTLSGEKTALCYGRGKYSSFEGPSERGRAKSGGIEIAVKKRGSRSIRATIASRRDRCKAARYKMTAPKSAQEANRNKEVRSQDCTQQQQRQQKQRQHQNPRVSQKQRPWGAGTGTQATFSTPRSRDWRTVKGFSAGSHGCTKHYSSEKKMQVSSLSSKNRWYPSPPLTPPQQSHFSFGTLTLDGFLPNWSSLIAEGICLRGAERDLSNIGNPCDSTYHGGGFIADPTDFSFDDDTFSRNHVSTNHDLITVVSRERGKQQGMRRLQENLERCGSALKQCSSTNHAQQRDASGREGLRSVGGRRGVIQCLSVPPLSSGVEGHLMEWPRSRRGQDDTRKISHLDSQTSSSRQFQKLQHPVQRRLTFTGKTPLSFAAETVSRCRVREDVDQTTLETGVRSPSLLPDQVETTRDSEGPEKVDNFFAVEDYESNFDA